MTNERASSRRAQGPPIPGLVDVAADVPDVIAVLEGCDVLTVDTEFLWERTYYPKLALLQVAGAVGEHVEAFAIDPLAVDVAPVVELLADESRLKVFHAGRIDLQILHRELGRPLGPVFDTQIAAALLGHGPQIGYANLVQAILGQTIKKVEQYADWTRRPLREAQVEYALDDVDPLLEVYEHLRSELARRGRTTWAEEEMAYLTDPASYVEDDPRELWQKIKGKRVLDRRGLGALRELAVWRDAESRRRDLRPGFVIKDQVLVDIAARRPKNVRGLQNIRGLHKNEVKRNADPLLACLKRAEKLPDDQLPKQKRGRRGARAEVAAAVDLLKACLSLRASEVGVASETLATSSDLEALARDKKREQFAKDHAVLNGWRRELVGEDLLKILKGEMTLGVDPDSSELRLM